MGGRGSSSGGGVTKQKVAIAQPPKTATQDVQKGENHSFMSLTDDGKAKMIEDILGQSVPVFLADNAFQKLTYSISERDLPTMVSDSVLDKTPGKEMFRTVNGMRDTKNGLTYDADMIAAQIQRGSVTRVSDSGGSVYGRGIYFATDYSSSASYGNVSGNIQKTAVVRAKLSPSAKTISHSQAVAKTNAEIASGSKLGKALAKCDSHSRISIYSYAKGYDVITSGSYMNVLRRSALKVSADIKARSSKW